MSLTDLNLLTFDTKLRLGREKNILQWSAAISRALFTLGLHTHSIQHSSYIYFVSHCAAFSKQLVKSLSLFHSLQHINDISLFQRPKSIKKVISLRTCGPNTPNQHHRALPHCTSFAFRESHEQHTRPAMKVEKVVNPVFAIVLSWSLIFFLTSFEISFSEPP